MADKDRVQRGLTAWEKAIDVQMHFNDLEIRIRNLALTLLAAIVGGVGLALEGDRKAVAAILLAAALGAWLSFYLMDRFWYHPLLKGAVDHAARLEDELGPDVPGVGLSKAIGKASPIVLRKEEGTKGEIAIHSSQKMDIFYGTIALLLLICFILVAFGAGTSQ
jgi:hypothetical protein